MACDRFTRFLLSVPACALADETLAAVDAAAQRRRTHLEVVATAAP